MIRTTKNSKNYLLQRGSLSATFFGNIHSEIFFRSILKSGFHDFSLRYGLTLSCGYKKVSVGQSDFTDLENISPLKTQTPSWNSYRSTKDEQNISTHRTIVFRGFLRLRSSTPTSRSFGLRYERTTSTHRFIVSGILPSTIFYTDIPLLRSSIQGIHWTSRTHISTIITFYLDQQRTLRIITF